VGVCAQPHLNLANHIQPQKIGGGTGLRVRPNTDNMYHNRYTLLPANTSPLPPLPIPFSTTFPFFLPPFFLHTRVKHRDAALSMPILRGGNKKFKNFILLRFLYFEKMLSASGYFGAKICPEICFICTNTPERFSRCRWGPHRCEVIEAVRVTDENRCV